MRREKPPGQNGGSVRAVLDTNVLLSGLLWHGTPHALIEMVRAGTLSLVISEHLIAELARTVTRDVGAWLAIWRPIPGRKEDSTTKTQSHEGFHEEKIRAVAEHAS